MKSNAVKYTLLFFSGIALTLSFAPFNVWPLSFFSLSILFYFWTESNSKHAFLMGLSFGIGFFLSGVYWIYIAIHHFGNAPIPLSVFLSALLILVLSLFIAINGYLNAKIGKAISMREGKDVLLLTTGITLRVAIAAAEELYKQTINANRDIIAYFKKIE